MGQIVAVSGTAPIAKDGSVACPGNVRQDLLREQQAGLEYQRIPAAAPSEVDDTKRQQLKAVQRWYFDDGMGLERKLRSSIVEGVSIFLALFDINPAVKRVFCPPKQTYDPILNASDRNGHYPYGKPLPSFSCLIGGGRRSRSEATASRGDGSRATSRSPAAEAALVSVGSAGVDPPKYEDNEKAIAESSTSIGFLSNE